MGCRGHGEAADGGFAAASRADSAGRRNQSGRPSGAEGGVSERSLRIGANDGLLVAAKALPGASGSLPLERILKRSQKQQLAVYCRRWEGKMEIPAKKESRMTKTPTSLVNRGEGFMGSHVAEHLFRMGHNVVVLDDLSGGFQDNVPANSEFVQGSVLDHELINRLFDHYFFDYVYHLAALRTIAAIRIKQ